MRKFCARGKQGAGADANTQRQRAAMHLQRVDLRRKFYPQQKASFGDVYAGTGGKLALTRTTTAAIPSAIRRFSRRR